jgi:hypothetical protein
VAEAKTSGTYLPSKPGKVAAKAARMLTAAAEAGEVELIGFAVRLTCSSHISSDEVGGRFSRRGVRAAEKISEVGFLYEDPGRHAQPHTNHKPPFHSANDTRPRGTYNI